MTSPSSALLKAGSLPPSAGLKQVSVLLPQGSVKTFWKLLTNIKPICLVYWREGIIIKSDSVDVLRKAFRQHVLGFGWVFEP